MRKEFMDKMKGQSNELEEIFATDMTYLYGQYPKYLISSRLPNAKNQTTQLKQCEHWGTRVSFISVFLGVYAQQWDSWVVWHTPAQKQWLWGRRRAERSYPKFRVRRDSCEEIPLVQGKEQWLCFAGAAVKRTTMSKVRETQVRW